MRLYSGLNALEYNGSGYQITHELFSRTSPVLIALSKDDPVGISLQRRCRKLERWSCHVTMKGSLQIHFWHTITSVWQTEIQTYTVSQKTVQHCFCHNFVTFPPILIICGRKMAKRLKLCEVHSFSTSSNSRHHYRVKRRRSNCYTTLIIRIRLLTFASSIRQKAPRDLISLWD